MNQKQGIGVDIIHVDRVRKALDQEGKQYLDAVFTPEEQLEAEEHPNPMAYYATRFAAKEAIFKCLNTTWDDDMDWTQIALKRNPDHGISAHLTGRIAECPICWNPYQIQVSISWDTDYAVAFATINTV